MGFLYFSYPIQQVALWQCFLFAFYHDIIVISLLEEPQLVPAASLELLQNILLIPALEASVSHASDFPIRQCPGP